MKTPMKADHNITPEFVDFIPRTLERNILYVSMEHATVSHSCFCGCGAEVVTPLSPVNWQLMFDGETVSLSPSVGSWHLPCQSHYWIRKSKVVWAGKMSKEQIAEVKRRDAADALRHFGGGAITPPVAKEAKPVAAPKTGFWHWLRGLFG